MSEIVLESASSPVPEGDRGHRMEAVHGGIFPLDFTGDEPIHVRAQIRAAFYPKFSNDHEDKGQKMREKMIQLISNGLASLEVSLKHSGSLFMYAGRHGGAYAKNSYGNIYTAVGVFVLGRTFLEAWGTEAAEKQMEFSNFLEENHICISMELVTAVLGDHGQRPIEDYLVVTAVANLGSGKPKFYSTPDIIAFCNKWRLPTNHVWLLSTRESVTSFFATYEKLYEDGIATSVCKALDDIADFCFSGSKDYTKVQGEILEGLVARIVSHDISKETIIPSRDLPFPSLRRVSPEMGPSLRDICCANRSTNAQRIKALLQSDSVSCDYSDWNRKQQCFSNQNKADQNVLQAFLQAHPVDSCTSTLQEMARTLSKPPYNVKFRFHECHHTLSKDVLHFKLVIHVHRDSDFKRYNKEMKRRLCSQRSDQPELWPLCRGFFIDVNLFKANKGNAAEVSLMKYDPVEHDNYVVLSRKDCLFVDGDTLMLKLKFLTYKLRTFLMRNGLSHLFKGGLMNNEAYKCYKDYCQRQMKGWSISPAKTVQLNKMLDEWAIFIKRRYTGDIKPSQVTYLTEAEPFLQQYAERSLENSALIGFTGNIVRVEDWLVTDGNIAHENYISSAEQEKTCVTPKTSAMGSIIEEKDLVFFSPGTNGSGKSALCHAIMNAQERLGTNRPLCGLESDVGKENSKVNHSWKVVEECKNLFTAIILDNENVPDVDCKQVPSDAAAKPVLKHLDDFSNGGLGAPHIDSSKSKTPYFASVDVPIEEVDNLLDNLIESDSRIKEFIQDKNIRKLNKKIHVTLAHKESHGVDAVISYAAFLHQTICVDLTAFLFSDQTVALEAHIKPLVGEKISSMNDWPHATLWTRRGTPPKNSNMLPQLLSEGRATRIEINPSISVCGTLQIH